MLSTRKRREQAQGEAMRGLLRINGELVTKIQELHGRLTTCEEALALAAQALGPVAGAAVVHNALLAALAETLIREGVLTRQQLDDSLAAPAATGSTPAA